jgi:non-ribosomal peptide synthetase component F
LIGFFVNLLPIRARVPGHITFRELLAQVKQTSIQAYAHQDVPFDKLVEEIRPERSTSHNPIVQVLLVMQSTPHAHRQLPGLRLEEIEAPINTSKFDLAVFIDERVDQTVGYWLYSSDLFDRSRIAAMTRHFETLLQSAVANPDARLSALEMVSEAERQQEEMEARRQRQMKSKRLMMTAPEAVGVSLSGGQGA